MGDVTQFPRVAIIKDVPQTRKEAFDAYLQVFNHTGKRAPKYATFSAGASWAATLIHNKLIEQLEKAEAEGILDLDPLNALAEAITDVQAMRREGMAYDREDNNNEH